MKRLGLPATGVALLLGCVQALAETGAEAPLLVVDPPGQGEHSFTRAELMAMPQLTYRTSTIWTEGVREFRGVPLSEVLKEAGVTGGTLELEASNDYSAEMPVSMVTPDVPILAMTLDGVPMTLRDKGPLWVIFPYDQSNLYQSEVVYTRSVWQLVRIEVRP